MSCPKCGTANEDDARFCIQCGTGLDAARESAAGARSGMRERPGAAASSRLKLSIVLLSGVILVVALALAAWLSLGGGAGVLGLAGRNGSPAEGKSQAAAQPGRTPTMPLGSDIFANPSQPAYVPGKGFAPDAQRIIDLASVRLSLERYRQSRGHIPRRSPISSRPSPPEQEARISRVHPLIQSPDGLTSTG